MSPPLSEKVSPYILTWDNSEKERMAIEEQFFFDCIYDGQYIPKGIVLSPTAHILDAGTGTGDYLLGVAKVVPESVQLDGVDITDALFLSTLPSNVHLAISSVMSLPSEWTGHFDFVHQRLMLPALLAAEWPKAISELHRVTKPGGLAQFVELSSDWPKGVGFEANERIRNLVAALQAKRGLKFDCAHHLEAMLKAAGFVDVAVNVKTAPLGRRWGAIGDLGTQNHGGALRHIKTAMLKEEVVSTGEEYDTLVDNVVKEWHEGENIHYNFYVVSGKKPV